MEHVSNKEKAQEIADKHKQQCYYAAHGDLDSSFEECYHSALQAMQWKDKQHEQEKQQWIDKAAEWIDNNVNHYIFENEYGETYIKYTFTEDFINAMKGA